MASVFGVEHQAKIASNENIFFIHVDIEIENSLTGYFEDGESDIEWLQSNFFGDKDPTQKDRQNKIGLSEYDFVNYAYPKLNSVFRNWWVAKLAENNLDDFQKHHIVFVTNLYKFPWALLPLNNGVAIGREFSVSCNHSESFTDDFSNNDSLLMTSGKLEATSHLFDSIFGSNLKHELALKGEVSLWRRGGNPSPVSEEICLKMAMGITGIDLQLANEISTGIFGKGTKEFLPSIWLHEGHGHDFGLEINGESQTFLRGKEILNQLNNLDGIIDFCWLSSCHSIELVHNFEIMKSGKVKTLLGHLGMGDEAGNVIAFEMLVLERIMKGFSLGKSVQLAKSALDSKMSASGSFTLLGDPRLVLIS